MKRAVCLLALLIAGCASEAPAPQPTAAPLPMRVPIKGVMAGVIDFSAHGVFTTATSATPLTQDDWVAAGLASINLIGAATLITSAGSGPSDSEWVASKEWQELAGAYQEASIRSAAAIRDRDRSAFLRAANTLADTCQSCHERFRITGQQSRSEFASDMAGRSLTPYARAWPAPPN